MRLHYQSELAHIIYVFSRMWSILFGWFDESQVFQIVLFDHLVMFIFHFFIFHSPTLCSFHFFSSNNFVHISERRFQSSQHLHLQTYHRSLWRIHPYQHQAARNWILRVPLVLFIFHRRHFSDRLLDADNLLVFLSCHATSPKRIRRGWKFVWTKVTTIERHIPRASPTDDQRRIWRIEWRIWRSWSERNRTCRRKSTFWSQKTKWKQIETEKINVRKLIKDQLRNLGFSDFLYSCAIEDIQFIEFIE